MLIHIGYHKTATTWLQRQLFIPEFGFHPVWDHYGVEAHITGPHELDFDSTQTRNALELQSKKCPDHLSPCISSEILSGLPYNGARESAAFARRLHAIDPQAKILITIREQKRLLVSLYMQYVRRGGTTKPHDFFSPPPELGYSRFDYQHLCFDRLVGYYQQLFGAGQVLVLPQELLVRQPQAFVDEIYDFAGVPHADQRYPDSARKEGASDQEFILCLTRPLNHFRRDSAGGVPVLNLGPATRLLQAALGKFSRSSVGRSLRRHQPISQLVVNEFSGRFRDSNTRLRGLCSNLDLTGYE